MIKKVAKKIKRNKFLNIAYGFIKFVLTVIILILLVIILLPKITNNNVSLGGIRIYNVASGSMYPEYEIGDILITQKIPEDQIKVGDNITYLGAVGEIKNLTITHKVQEIRKEEGKTYFTPKGIANENSDPEITYDQIFGKVVYKTRVLSFLSKLSTNLIVYLFVIIVGLVISVQIVKIIFSDELGDGQSE